MDRGKGYRDWGLEEWIGASVVLAIAVAVAITSWLGWGTVSRWL
jgi:membrane protein YdbS with pleckstrin-like domain